MLVERGIQLYRLSTRAFGPQLFTHAGLVVGDQRIGRIQDIGGGAVVLLQAHREDLGKVFDEVLYVLHFRPAPAVDRLVIVTHHEHPAAVAGQHAYPGVLDRIGVLELVDQQVPEAFAVVVEQAGFSSQSS